MPPDTVLVLNPAVPAKSVAELTALAKSQPGGTGQHLIGAQFESMAGVEILHVPYKGSGPLTTDLLGGQISMSFDTITPVLPQREGPQGHHRVTQPRGGASQFPE